MSRISNPLLALVVSIVFAATAGAATFTTPMVATNDHVPACGVTNIGTKPLVVTAELVGPAGNTVTPTSSSCPTPPATLAPRRTCYTNAPVGQDIYCIVEASSAKVRAGITLFSPNGLFVGFVPATK